MMLKLRIADTNTSGFTLWLPMIIAYLLLLVVFIILLPFLLLAAILLFPWGWAKPALLLIPRLCGVLCALRGLKVDIQQGNKKKVYISFD